MSVLKSFVDFILHIDAHLALIISQYGSLTYGLLFVVIFLETGLVITPFLPGDSLLFAAGAFAARGSLNIALVFMLVTLAAWLGDTANYWIGHKIGERIFTERSRVLKKEYLDRTHRFYERYGGMTIVLARFVPIIRTVAPFVAGVGVMQYPRFLLYNVIGGALWTALFTFGGYFFGTIPFVEKNFSLVIIAIVLLSLLPPIIEWLRHRRDNRPAPPPSSI